MLIFFSSQTDVWWQHHYKHGKKKNRFLHPTDVWRGRHLSQTCCLFANCGIFPSSCFIPKISYQSNSASIHMVILTGTQVRSKNSDVFQYTQIKKFVIYYNTQSKQWVVKIYKNLTVKIFITVTTKGDYLCLGRIKADHYNILTYKQKAISLTMRKKWTYFSYKQFVASR